ncbi:hypothetical protein [Streptomyces sp. NPDC054784]
MDLSVWCVADYRRHWRRALRRLGGSGESAVSCLIFSVAEPESGNFVFCWPLYREGDLVVVQNSVIFLDELNPAFDPDRPWLSVGPRESVDEDGNKISEWFTGMSQIDRSIDLAETGE